MIEIEKGVPIPERKPLSRNGRKPKYPFAEMAVGDSFAVIGKGAKTLGSTARNYAKHHDPGAKFTTRTEGDATRIWRTA